LRQPDHAVLRRHVAGKTGDRVEPGGRGRVDDRSAPRRQHRGDLVLESDEDAARTLRTPNRQGSSWLLARRTSSDLHAVRCKATINPAYSLSLSVSRTDSGPGVRDGYVTPSTSGHPRALATRAEGPVCRTNVSASARACTPLPPQNLHGKEGVDGSSPSEGLKRPANRDFVLSVLNRG